MFCFAAAAQACVHWKVHPRQHDTDESPKQEQHAGLLSSVLYDLCF